MTTFVSPIEKYQRQCLRVVDEILSGGAGGAAGAVRGDGGFLRREIHTRVHYLVSNI